MYVEQKLIILKSDITNKTNWYFHIIIKNKVKKNGILRLNCKSNSSL